MAGMQRAASELGPAAAGWGGGLVAGLAALLVSAALLAVWLELATLQREVHTLRGRLQGLENTCHLRAQLDALPQAIRYDERIKYRSGNEEVVVSFSEDETPTPTNQVVKKITTARMNDYNIDRDGHTGNGRHRRETVSGTRNPNLPDLQESGNSPRNRTDRENTSDDDNLRMLLSRDVSLTPSANHTTSAVILPDSASIAPLRKNNRARNRKKHTHRSETAVASATRGQPDTTEAAAITRHSRVAESDSGLMRSMGKSSVLRSQPTREESRTISGPLVHQFTRTRRRRPKNEVTRAAVEFVSDEADRPTEADHFVAAHYHGDTSRYSSAHQHYAGNGRLRHPDGRFRDWTPISWMNTLRMNNHVPLTNEGVVNVRSSGLYFLYAQIYYADVHDTNGFRLYRNNSPILHCTTHSSATDHSVKANTCFTATLEYLHENDEIYVSDVEGLRYSLFEPAKSFFGFFKVNDHV